MITGLQFDVKSTELQEQLDKQVNTSGKLESDGNGFAERLQEASPSAEVGHVISAVTSLRNNARARAESCRWLSRHVIPNETYRLSLTELSQIGVVRGFGIEAQVMPQAFQRPVSETRANA